MSPGAESRVISTMSSKGGLMDHIVGPASAPPLTDDFYRQAIFQHKKRKLEDPVRHFYKQKTMRINATEIFSISSN